MAFTEKQLFELKEEIEGAKTEVSELTGQKNALLKQLKEEYGCNTIEEAKKKLETLAEKIKSLDKRIEKGLDELEIKYSVEEEDE